MKKKFIISFATIIVFFAACETLNIVKITILETEDVTERKSTSAKVKSIIVDVSSDVKEIGHCWNKNGEPTINDSKAIITEDNYVQGVEIHTIMDNLTPNGRYNVRAYATTSEGEIYGNEVSFETGSVPFSFIDPNVHSEWEIGESKDIKWNYSDYISNVNINLYKTGELVKNIATNVEDNGIYNWTIPDLSSYFTEGFAYFTIIISDASNSNEKAESDSFMISQD